MEPQLVPIAPERKTDMRRMDLASVFREASGEDKKALYLRMLRVAKKMVKRRAIFGKAWIQYWM